MGHKVTLSDFGTANGYVLESFYRLIFCYSYGVDYFIKDSNADQDNKLHLVDHVNKTGRSL